MCFVLFPIHFLLLYIFLRFFRALCLSVFLSPALSLSLIRFSIPWLRVANYVCCFIFLSASCLFCAFCMRAIQCYYSHSILFSMSIGWVREKKKERHGPPPGGWEMQMNNSLVLYTNITNRLNCVYTQHSAATRKIVASLNTCGLIQIAFVFCSLLLFSFFFQFSSFSLLLLYNILDARLCTENPNHFFGNVWARTFS